MRNSLKKEESVCVSYSFVVPAMSYHLGYPQRIHKSWDPPDFAATINRPELDFTPPRIE